MVSILGWFIVIKITVLSDFAIEDQVNALLSNRMKTSHEASINIPTMSMQLWQGMGTGSQADSIGKNLYQRWETTATT
jgi:hypothetical protein